MKTMFRSIESFLILLIILISSSAVCQSNLEEKIRCLPGIVNVKSIEPGSDFKAGIRNFY